MVDRTVALSKTGSPSKVNAVHAAFRLELGIPSIASVMLHGMPFSGTDGLMPKIVSSSEI